MVRDDGITHSGAYFLNEVNGFLDCSAPEIKYKDDGACYWSIAVSSDGKPIVYIATSEGGSTWELQPDIDGQYR